MARIEWNPIGERYYETGVDRGVLYIGNNPGVPWSGLVAVNEEASGGEARPYYLDGMKYLNRSSPQEFTATIEAYTYPQEFAACDGSEYVKNGLYVMQQRRQSFDLAYRSLIGNDVDGINHAYKIHLVYGATAAPSSRSNQTIGDELEPFNFSWTISTKPPSILERRPTSHFVIDSRDAPRELMQVIEDVLYGNAKFEPRIPSVGELLYLFETFASGFFDAGEVGSAYYNTYDGGNLNLDPNVLTNGSFETGIAPWTVTGNAVTTSTDYAAMPDGTQSARVVAPTTGVAGTFTYPLGVNGAPVNAGEVWTITGLARTVTAPRLLSIRARCYTSTGAAGSPAAIDADIASTAVEGWTMFTNTFTVPAGVSFISPQFVWRTDVVAGDVYYFDRIRMFRGTVDTDINADTETINGGAA